MDILEAGFEDAVAVLVLPERYHKRFRTTVNGCSNKYKKKSQLNTKIYKTPLPSQRIEERCFFVFAGVKECHKKRDLQKNEENK
ncbi:hypothetical protein [Carboxydothermus pertinax]|uniref:Transposase n=1 Tax=Carboxydothermus pertinax TaxID=870242 RepID=A0A1L8CUZ0_9THEO|nr:hypothetical protein [Carboxydothermus pertinax]GAV22722.1 transposase [Carboxydothermus pertinax]